VSLEDSLATSPLHIGSKFGPGSSTGNHPAAAAVDYRGKFLYVVNQNGNDISEYSIDQTSGALTPLTPATVDTGKGPTSIVVTGTLK
jgi:6-phosphogluconolactonase